MTTSRGWIVDALIAIGHYEAALSHLDEDFDHEEYAALGKAIYNARVDLETSLNIEEDQKPMWCVLKHLATAYVMSGEVSHAKGFDSVSRFLTEQSGDALATAAEIALGLEKTECLRCLSERSGKPKDGKS